MEQVYAWTGWLTGVALLGYAQASTECSWFVRLALALTGAYLLLYWLLEHVEVRHGAKLMGLRKAFLPILFAGPVVLIVGGLGWITAKW
jgi:hypothetical protein